MNPLNLFQEDVSPKVVSQGNLNNSTLKPKEMPKLNGARRYLELGDIYIGKEFEWK